MARVCAKKSASWLGALAPSVLVLGALGWSAQGAAAAPSFQFSSPNVAVSQVTPGGAIALFYTGHEWQEPVVRRKSLCQKLVDFDGNGVVSYTASNALVSKAVWAAVDLANGSVTIGAPNGFQPTALVPSVKKMLDIPGTVVSKVQSLHLLLIRPGVDAWSGSSFDGAAGDTGPADDGEVRLGVDSMRSLSTGALAAGKLDLQAGDILVGLDPERLAYFVVTVP